MLRTALALLPPILSLPGLCAAVLQVDQPVYDFGRVTAGYVVQHAFRLINAGDELLRFLRPPQTSCGCTYAPLPVTELPPGGEMELVVTLDTTGYDGKRIAKPVDLFTNAPGARRVRLTLREPAEYAAGHLLGAVNIPFPELEPKLAPLPRNIPLYLYDANGGELPAAIEACSALGFTAVRGLAGGAAGWLASLGELFWVGQAPGGEPATAQGGLILPPEDLAREYVVVLDLRPREDYRAGHLPGAIPISLGELAAFSGQLPRPRGEARLLLWCVDEEGEAACRAARLLREMGFPDAACVIGGLGQWRLLFGEALLIPSSRSRF